MYRLHCGEHALAIASAGGVSSAAAELALGAGAFLLEAMVEDRDARGVDGLLAGEGHATRRRRACGAHETADYARQVFGSVEAFVLRGNGLAGHVAARDPLVGGRIVTRRGHPAGARLALGAFFAGLVFRGSGGLERAVVGRRGGEDNLVAFGAVLVLQGAAHNGRVGPRIVKVAARGGDDRTQCGGGKEQGRLHGK